MFSSAFKVVIFILLLLFQMFFQKWRSLQSQGFRNLFLFIGLTCYKNQVSTTTQNNIF